MDKGGGLQYKIECSIHKGNYLEAINISQNQKNQHLKCIECIQDENISPNLFIPISKIENSKDDTVLSNWPPLSEGLIKKLNNLTREQNEHLQKTKESVAKFFADFKEELLNTLSVKEKEAFKVLEMHSEKINKNVSIYNQISSKDKLKEILHNYESNHHQSDQLLNKLIAQKYQEKQQNSKTLDDILNESALNQLIFNDNLSFRQDTIRNIQKLTVINSTKQIPKVAQSQPSQIQQSTNQQQQQQQEHHHHHHHISNSNNNQIESNAPSNIQQQQKHMQQHQYYISSRKQSTQQQPTVLTQQYQPSQHHSHAIQSNEKNQNSNQKTKKNVLTEQFFEEQGIQNINYEKGKSNINQRRLNIDMINSRFEQSEQGIIKKKERGEIVIKNLYKQCIQSFSDLIIEKDKRYIIDIEIHNGSETGEQYIGLIKDSTKDDQHLNKSSLCFLPMEDIWIDSYSSVIQGQRIRHYQYSDPISIQMLVHLKDRFIQFADSPNRNNIIQIKPDSIDLNQYYRIGTHLCKQNDKIVIKNVYMVPSFDDI